MKPFDLILHATDRLIIEVSDGRARHRLAVTDVCAAESAELADLIAVQPMIPVDDARVRAVGHSHAGHEAWHLPDEKRVLAHGVNAQCDELAGIAEVDEVQFIPGNRRDFRVSFCACFEAGFQPLHDLLGVESAGDGPTLLFVDAEQK